MGVELRVERQQRGATRESFQPTAPNTFEDPYIKIVWQPQISQLGFTLTNKTDSSLRVLWDDASYRFRPGISLHEIAAAPRGQRSLANTSTKAKVAFTEPFERCAVGTSHVGIERLGRGHEPGVILAHTPRSTTLQERTSLCLREVDTLNDEALQKRQRSRLVRRPFEDLFDGDNRDHQSTSPQPAQ